MASSTGKAKERKIVLRSLEGEEFEVDEATARKSATISNMIDDGCAEDAIPLLNVNSTILAKVIEYCGKHAFATDEHGQCCNNGDAELKRWDDAYIDVDQAILHDLLLAANYLNIKALLDLACEKVASMIRGKSVEEIRKTFHIKNDFTLEEEEQIRKQCQWIFE